MTRILAAHDFSGFGHTSLMAAIAIFYRMGIRVAALPTALLSANTDHPDYLFIPYDIGMKRYLAHWQQLGLSFDGICTGFLGSPEQVQILLDYIPQLARPPVPVLVDPVLGDHGVFYDCFDARMLKAMQRLLAIASIITPNSTEAAFLLDEEPSDDFTRDWRSMAFRLAELGPPQVIISSIPSENPMLRYCGVCDSIDGSWQLIPYQINGGAHPGSGDCFASFLFAGILKGYDLLTSAKAAVEILNLAISLEQGERPDWREGILLEQILDLDLNSYYEPDKGK